MIIRLVALDLDGTTLRSDHSLSERVRNTLEKAIEQGTEIVIATGRTVTSVPRYIMDIPGIRYFITSNGAQIYDKKQERFIYSRCIEEDAVTAVIEAVRDKNVMVEVCSDGMAYTDSFYYNMACEGKLTYRNQKYIVDTRIPVDGYLDFMYEKRNELENISISSDSPVLLDDIRRRLEVIPGLTVTSSFRYNVEAGGSDVSKGNALIYVCGLLGIPMAETMGIGDSGNDVALLRACGLKIAVANAVPELKQEADYITESNNDDGAALAIEEFVTGKC